MEQLIDHLFSARLDNVLIIAGLFFLAIGVIGRIAGKIEPGTGGRIAAAVVGGALLITGMVIHSHETPGVPIPGLSTPTPAPTPRPTPPVVRAVPPAPPLQVLSVALAARLDHYRGPCPRPINFAGAITVRGTGTVRYRFLRADRSSGPVESLQFDVPGIQRVSGMWFPPRASLGQAVSSWMQLEVLAPQPMLSNQATFTVECTSWAARPPGPQVP